MVNKYALGSLDFFDFIEKILMEILCLISRASGTDPVPGEGGWASCGNQPIMQRRAILLLRDIHKPNGVYWIGRPVS
jgi:hypothetical protein